MVRTERKDYQVGFSEVATSFNSLNHTLAAQRNLGRFCFYTVEKGINKEWQVHAVRYAGKSARNCVLSASGQGENLSNTGATMGRHHSLSQASMKDRDNGRDEAAYNHSAWTCIINSPVFGA